MTAALGIGIIGGVLCYLLSEMKSRLAVPVGAITAVLVLINAVSGVFGIGEGVLRIIAVGGVGEVGRDALKILGTGYIFGSAADTLEQLGEGGISRALDVACRVEIMLISFPYIEKIIAFGLSVIKG